MVTEGWMCWQRALGGSARCKSTMEPDIVTGAARAVSDHVINIRTYKILSKSRHDSVLRCFCLAAETDSSLQRESHLLL
jgi:hypothetical protein